MDDEHEGCEFEEPKLEPRRLHWADLIQVGVDLIGRTAMGVMSTCAQASDMLAAHAAKARDERQHFDEMAVAMDAMDLLPTKREGR